MKVKINSERGLWHGPHVAAEDGVSRGHQFRCGHRGVAAGWGPGPKMRRQTHRDHHSQFRRTLSVHAKAVFDVTPDQVERLSRPSRLRRELAGAGDRSC